MARSDVSGIYAIGIVVLRHVVTFLLPRGGTVLFSFILDSLKSDS